MDRRSLIKNAGIAGVLAYGSVETHGDKSAGISASGGTLAGILALDGLTNGAIYALLALATVLVFAVTRVIFIPQGEFVAFGALTLALFQLGKVPGTVWFLLVLAAAVALQDIVNGLRHGQRPGRLATQTLRTLVWPVVVSAVTVWAAPRSRWRWSRPSAA